MDLELTKEVSRVVGHSTNLETLARPLLEILHRLTGLDVTYLTEVDLVHDQQLILYSERFEGVDVPEGLVVEWSDTLCKRALDTGIKMTADVATTFPGSDAAAALGLETYVSVPVTDTENVVLGTLCGASGQALPQGDDVLDVMDLFARLIADQWRRDAALTDANERAREAEEQLTDRALQIAESEHKLKTPLTIIRGWSTLLDEDADSFPKEKVSQAIGLIREAADKLTIQLDEAIERSRQTALATAELEVAPVDLGELLERVAVELRGMSAKHILKATVVGAIVIESNETTLWHILHHLGENAVKYSPNGGAIDLSAHKTGKHAVISVRDEGPGLPEGVDVFQPFVRGDEEATAGSGLGLHIVQTLVRSLKGSVTYKSEPGHGANFLIYLPLDGNVPSAK